jgi:hypothetical protein
MVAGRAVLVMVSESSNRLRDGGAPTLILGAGRVGHLIARRAARAARLGLRPIGFLDPEPARSRHSSGLPVLSAAGRLEQVVRENGVEHAIISFSNAPYDTQLELSRLCRNEGLGGDRAPPLRGLPDRMTLERVAGLPLVMIHPPTQGTGESRSVCARPAAGPARDHRCLATADPGRCRHGAHHRPPDPLPPAAWSDDREFEMLKFRTMTGRPEEHGEADAQWAARIAGEDAAIEDGVPHGPPISGGPPGSVPSCGAPASMSCPSSSMC